MSTQSILCRDINGYVNYGLIPADDKVKVNLTTSTEATFTVPGDAGFLWDLVFSVEPGSSVWFAYTYPGRSHETAEIPAGSTFSSTNSELNPAVRRVPGGTVVSAITANTTAAVGVLMYVFSQ